MPASSGAALADNDAGGGTAQRKLDGHSAADRSKDPPARQIVKHAPWVIERKDLDIDVVRKAIWFVHEGLRRSSVSEDQALLFVDA